MLYKYVIKNVARKHGQTATFMPKPLFGDNGSGMHTHQSLWKKEQAVVRGKGIRWLEPDGAFYIGGSSPPPPPPALCAEPTATSASFPVTKRRSTWPTVRVSVPPPCASRPSAKARRPSALISSAGPGGQSVPGLAALLWPVWTVSEQDRAG